MLEGALCLPCGGPVESVCVRHCSRNCIYLGSLGFMTKKGTTGELPGQNLEVVWGQVFNNKLGTFALLHNEYMVHTQPLLELNIRPRLSPEPSVIKPF